MLTTVLPLLVAVIQVTLGMGAGKEKPVVTRKEPLPPAGPKVLVVGVSDGGPACGTDHAVTYPKIGPPFAGSS